MDILNFNLDEIERWLLMFFRIMSMLIVMPFYGFSAFPVRVRVALAFAVTVLLFPLHVGTELQLDPGVLSFFGAVLKEAVIGLAIGMVGTFLFYGVQFAGQVIGHTMGFGIINVVDPQSQTNVPLLAQLLYFFVLMLFLLLGGHHFLMLAIDETFVKIPVGGGIFSPLLVEGFSRMSADIFAAGIKIGAPVLVTVLVTEFALGIIARTVPQVNVWLVGFPLKIGLGLITLGLSLPFIVYVFGKFYAGWQGSFLDFIHTMSG